MHRPSISTNLAISIDGKISSSPPRPSGWTSREDHARLLELRNKADAILVGRGTLESDRMTLTVPGKSSQPLRCIVSRSGRIDPTHPVFNSPGGEIHLLVTGESEATDASNIILHRQSLPSFLETLGSTYGIGHLHCEGGGQLILALAKLDVIDEFHLTLAGHTLFSGVDAATSTGIPGAFLPKSIEFKITRFEPSADTGECFLSYARCRTPNG